MNGNPTIKTHFSGPSGPINPDRGIVRPGPSGPINPIRGIWGSGPGFQISRVLEDSSIDGIQETNDDLNMDNDVENAKHPLVV